MEISPEEAMPYLTGDPIIVEAGAFDGADTLRLASLWPAGTVHAFEPVPEAFATVLDRTRDLPHVHCYEMALAAGTGSSVMHVSAGNTGGGSSSSSLLAPTEHLKLLPEIGFERTVEVRTMTLDDWAEQNDVSAVDFMWLDMQGVELDVLRASPRMLSTATTVVMEVSRRELYAGCARYAEVKAWMRGEGFDPVIDRVSMHWGNMMFVRRSKLT